MAGTCINFYSYYRILNRFSFNDKTQDPTRFQISSQTKDILEYTVNQQLSFSYINKELKRIRLPCRYPNQYRG